MRAVISLPSGSRELEVGWLDVVRLFAAHRGYSDVDVEPWAGKTTITVRGEGLPIIEKSGADIATVAEKVIHVLA